MTLDSVEDGEREAAATTAIEDRLVGQLIDERYRILSRLGVGGMGIVYEARHEILGSRLAFKVLRRDAAGDEEAVERLKREAQSASAVGNEHIVDVRDFGRLDDGSVYIVMELIEGSDLYSVVKQAPVGSKRMIEISIQICEALFAAHEQGIVHRDLKLENVLLTSRRGKGDFVKIVDFGIAKVQGGTKLTAAGRVMGTPEYMSPEQCSGKQVDHRTDIYSLGVMMYEMLTQKLPFWDEDLLALVRMQMHQAPAPPSTVRTDVEIPLALEAVVLRCMAKDPASRYPTMRSVKHALRVANGEDVDELEDTKPPGELEEAAKIAVRVAEANAVAARATPTQGSVPTRRSWTWPVVVLGTLVAVGAIGWVAASALDAPPRDERSVAPRAAAPAEPEEELAASAPVDTEPPTTVEVPSEITIVTDPPGAQVLTPEDAFLGETPFMIRRPPRGEGIQLVLRRAGFQPQRLAVTALTIDEVHVELRRAVHTGRREPAGAPAAAQPAQNPAQQQPRTRQTFIDPWGAQAQ